VIRGDRLDDVEVACPEGSEAGRGIRHDFEDQPIHGCWPRLPEQPFLGSAPVIIESLEHDAFSEVSLDELERSGPDWRSQESIDADLVEVGLRHYLHQSGCRDYPDPRNSGFEMEPYRVLVDLFDELETAHKRLARRGF